MKSKITFLFLFAMILSSAIQSQTIVYNESTSSGIWFADGSEVSNPNPDSVNGSTKSAATGPSNWSQIQYFPTFTPSIGDKIYFSIYNPSNVGPGQLQFEYTSSSGTWQWGGNLTYDAASTTGWAEYSIDLSSHVGNEINKIIFMPAGNSSAIVYLDNVYFSSQSLNVSQTNYIYNESTSSGIWFADGSEVSNPNPDSVNGSTNSAATGPSNWSQIQYFPTFTPSIGDKIYFSIYNPSNVGPGQLQFEYTSSSGTWQWGGNLTYDAASTTGWAEYSIDLSSHVGNEINKIIFMPAGNSSSIIYLDNVYVANQSVLGMKSYEPLNERVFFDASGRINFAKNQMGTKLHVFDIQGRLIMKETIRGTKSSKAVNNTGVYILQINKDNVYGVKKIIFN
ncbi:hypothetical protein GCM10007962_03230 [Yeosuana aromativorans]|uniref:Secretion system C-terminal sorting domain-containing protein n=1 Tax=Yeosuana aromativorans TaxID=288019 RepID=A0A8J3BFZ0_9FLAO|nr:T9SS type A sorting domain-containing protein [Yeosuana aromativorans]GGK12244.1 hypothetical protein GCM10007962_03230 [Yeosuana aromativorans]